MTARKWLTFLASMLLTACSGGSSSPPADLAATWNATRLEFVSQAAPVQRVELISLGGTAVLVLASDHAFTLTVTVPGEPQEVTTGTWSASGDVLTLRESATSTMQFDYVLSGDTLTLTGADAEFDFDGNGTAEPATVNVQATRQAP